MNRGWALSWGLSITVHITIFAVLAYCGGLSGDFIKEVAAEPRSIMVELTPAPPLAAASLPLSSPPGGETTQQKPEPVFAGTNTSSERRPAAAPPTEFGGTAEPGAPLPAAGTGAGGETGTGGNLGTGQGSGGKPAGGINKAAYVISGPAPEYPEEARSNRWEGRVEVKMLVAENGEVAEVYIVSSSGYRSLDNAALRCVRGWRFSPKYVDGQPVATWFVKPVAFRLQ
ncbi:MAG TPA: energy transducer TonB [Patescibacteria group bacterium]|nr:energy transducer TonB [Patescibacteria group bacterium]